MRITESKLRTLIQEAIKTALLKEDTRRPYGYVGNNKPIVITNPEQDLNRENLVKILIEYYSSFKEWVYDYDDNMSDPTPDELDDPVQLTFNAVYNNTPCGLEISFTCLNCKYEYINDDRPSYSVGDRIVYEECGYYELTYCDFNPECVELYNKETNNEIFYHEF